MASSITHNNDFYASSSRARSVDIAAAGLLQTPGNNHGWCAAHLRLSRRSSDGAPRIFCFVIGKLLLPAAMAEPRAAANKKTDKEAPAQQNSKNNAGKASTMLAEAVAAAVPAASHMEPRVAQKAGRLNAKTKTEVSEKSKSAFKMARWRAARKAAHEAAAAARAGKNALKQRRKQASGSESEAVSPGGSPLVADSFVNAVARQLRRPGASRTEYFEFHCKPLRQFSNMVPPKGLAKPEIHALRRGHAPGASFSLADVRPRSPRLALRVGGLLVVDPVRPGRSRVRAFDARSGLASDWLSPPTLGKRASGRNVWRTAAR